MDLVSVLNHDQLLIARHKLTSISPDDGKYSKECMVLSRYLSADAEWRACALVQSHLIKTRAEFGLATEAQAESVRSSLADFDPLNAAMIEDKIKQDQLAVIEELGRHMEPELKALLHPGTTSYDILDTARPYLLKKAWAEELGPKAAQVALKLADLSEKTDALQVGRTHLQHTSPVPLCATFAGYAARIANRIERADYAFSDLRGKISGIVGTGAGVEAVIGRGKSAEFEREVLSKLSLKADPTATQVVQKERLADAGHSIVTLMHVVGDFAEDMRGMYSSEIGEMTSVRGRKELGGSSADAAKNNPIDWENISGKVAVVESGMRVLYAMIQSDFQRDLRSSVQARYQPAGMIAETYESLVRCSKAIDQLVVIEDRMAANLDQVRRFPSEAMTAITRAHGYVHPQLGVGHDAVKEYSKRAKSSGRRLLEVALEDGHFKDFYATILNDDERQILWGELELYVGHSRQLAKTNAEYARSVAHKFI